MLLLSGATLVHTLYCATVGSKVDLRKRQWIFPYLGVEDLQLPSSSFFLKGPILSFVTVGLVPWLSRLRYVFCHGKIIVGHVLHLLASPSLRAEVISPFSACQDVRCWGGLGSDRILQVKDASAFFS